MKRVVCLIIVVMLAACTPGATAVPTGPTPTANFDAATLPAQTFVPIGVGGEAVEDPQLTSFQMINEVNGWGLTESGVLRTIDGGATWHDATPPGMPVLGYGAASSYVSVVHAAIVSPDASDPMHAGTLYKTQDGGATWTSNPVPFGTCQLRFFDLPLQRGWAMVSLGVAAGSNAIAIFQTKDGGETWEQTFTNDPNVQGASNEIPLGGLKGLFYALSVDTAWVGGVIYSDATVYLFRTDDGGRHWKPVELQKPAGSEQRQFTVDTIQFVTGEDGFLSMQVTGANVRRAVYATHDGGDTWTLMPEAIPNGRAVDFISENDGFAFDGEQFLVTHDGAASWSPVKPDVVFSDSFMSMEFVDATTGWVLTLDPTTSKAVLYKTSDGAKTWMPQ